MINININDLIVFEERVYKVVKKPYNRNDGQQGLRVMLILLKQDGLNHLLIEQERLKGGVKDGDK